MRESSSHELPFARVAELAEYTVHLKRAYAFLGPAVGVLFLLGVVLPGLLSEETTIRPSYRIGVFCGLALLPAFFGWIVWKNGLFVVAANAQGVFYRVWREPDRAVFVPWEAVHEVRVVSDEGSKEVELALGEAGPELPKPANGNTWREGGKPRIDFRVGLFNRAREIAEELNRLKAQQR